MDFNISLGWAGWAVLILGSLAVGIVIQLFGEPRFGYEWLLTAIGGAVGVVVASEFITGMRDFVPVWDGLALIPALAGGLIVALAVAVVTRVLSGGSFTARAIG